MTDQQYDPAYDLMAPGGGGAFGQPDQGTRASDYGRAAGAGVLDLGASLSSGARAGLEDSSLNGAGDLAQYFHDLLKRQSEKTEEGMTPDARKDLHAAITSPEFWAHPFAAAGLKAANITPTVAASVAPAVLSDGALVPWLTAGTGAAMGAGQSAEDSYAQTDSMSDEDLQKHMPYYAGLRSMGVPEETARAEANAKLRGLKTVLNAAAGGAAMLMGPGGRMAGILPEGAGAGLLTRMGAGAAEGAAGGALMGGTAEAAHEQTEIQLDKRTQLDPALIAAAAGEQGLELGAMGAVGGVFTGHGEAVAKKAPAPRVETVDARGPDAAQAAALNPEGEATAPPPPAPAAEATPPEKVTPPGNDTAPAVEPTMTEQVMADQPTEAGAALDREFPRVPQPASSPTPVAPDVAADQGQTVPESQPTLQAQQDQLVAGERRAMLYPKQKKGEPKAELPLPDGMRRTITKDGTFHYNPDFLKPKDVYDASKTGRLNDILDLGQYSKKDLQPLVNAGEPAVAVTERTPEGTEVKAAAGTTSTAPDQVRSLEAMKTPGNVVAVEPVQKVLADRRVGVAPDARVKPPAREVVKVKPVEPQEARPAALSPEAQAKIEAHVENLRKVAEAQAASGFPLKEGTEAFLARKRAEALAAAQKELGGGIDEAITPPRARATEKGEGKHYTQKQKDDRAANNAKADAVVARFEPSPQEVEDFAGQGRELLAHRLRSMLDASQKEGVKLPTKMRDATAKEMEHNNSVAVLSEARALLKGRKEAPSADEAAKFRSRETQLRTGKAEDKAAVLAERRAEGEAKYARSKVTDNTIDPEAAREAESIRLEDIPDETSSSETQHESGHEGDEVTQAPREPTERAPVTLKGNEVQAVKDRAGTFKSETVKQRKRVTNKAAFDDFDQPHMAAAALRLEKAVEGKSIHEVAEHIGNNAPRMADRYIARRIGKVLKKMEANGVKFEFKVTHVGDTVPRALFNARGLSIASNADRSSKIYINGSDVRGKEGVSYQTILHELIHTATQQALYIGEHGKGEFAAKQLRRDLVALTNKLVSVFNDKARRYQGGDMSALSEFEKAIFNRTNNAMQNEHEVLAWGMSNPHMQDFMESVPYKKGSLFTEFVDSVRRFLGLAPRQDTALSELIRISENLFDLNDAEIGTRMRANAYEQGWIKHAQQAGDFSAGDNDINRMFHPGFSDALERSRIGAVNYTRDLLKPAKFLQSSVNTARATGGVLSRALRALTTNDQYRQQIEHLVPMARDLFDNNERAGVVANKLKETGVDLTGALIRAQKANPGLFEKFARLINDQTMMGADASSAIGVGRNAHLALSKELQAKIDAGAKLEDLASDAAMKSWEARSNHQQLADRYNAIVGQDPQYRHLQSQLFDYYEKTQSAIVRSQIDSILRTYDFKGTEDERAAMASQLYSGKMSDEIRAKLEENIGKQAVKQIENTQGLKVVNGPYAPQMRRGEHAVLGEYKVTEPGNGTKVADKEATWEFKTRKEAHDFAVKSGLHSDTKSVYYDTATGKRVKAKADAISTAGQPEQRFQVTLQKQHLEFHETAAEARERLEELKNSGLMEKVGMEERRHIEGESSQFSGRGVESLLNSLAAQKHYQDASEHERAVMRHTIREAGLRSMSENRVQARRLPRRYVKGASDDIARNLYDYNNSQANYRARMQFRDAIDKGLKAMWDHVKSNRYTPENDQRSAAANEIERRMQAQDPNDYTGSYTEWTRRLGTWSYIDRMMRPSHLILHQTHLPMITAPYMAGRHGVLSSYGAVMKAWKDLTGFYGAGGHDAWATTWGSALQKGADYTELGKAAYKNQADGARLGKMLDTLGEIGVIHPSSGIEAQKYMPSRQLNGPIGALDRGLNKMDTIFRHLTNAAEAVNRIAGATAAYRLEFGRLTRAGKGEAEAHDAATEYARQTLTDTQGLYSATNAAPIFKNKFLKPFLQFKQFPQMMYHLLGKLAVTAFKGETRQAQVQAVASLAAILGMHSMMAGVIQGVPMEPFKLLGLVSKGIGLTDSDWTDVEDNERRAIKSTFGEDIGNVLIHGVGSEAMGVDVHHRLGLNSFGTYGMPEQLDSKSVSEFVINAVLGAPGSLVTDALKGTHKMLNGDMEGGALQAAPLQALRDIHNAIAPAPNKYGYEATGADRAKSLLGFTPAAKAQAAERKEAIYNATHDYDTQRNNLTKAWLDSADKDAVWQKISAWNADKTGDARLTRGDLFKALHRANSVIGYNRAIGGVKTTPHNKGIAQSVQELYE